MRVGGSPKTRRVAEEPAHPRVLGEKQIDVSRMNPGAISVNVDKQSGCFRSDAVLSGALSSNQSRK